MRSSSTLNLAINKSHLYESTQIYIFQVYKYTISVDLLEVDFSFHEGNHKVKKITEVTSRDHEASFIENYHPPRFIIRKMIKEVKGNEGGQGKPW